MVFGDNRKYFFRKPINKIVKGPSLKLKTDTGSTTKIRDLWIDWAAMEEREEGGQIVQVIEGQLKIGNDLFRPENKYQFNGTLTPYGQDFIVAIQGSKMIES
jgi:hypothetical protein